MMRAIQLLRHLHYSAKETKCKGKGAFVCYGVVERDVRSERSWAVPKEGQDVGSVQVCLAPGRLGAEGAGHCGQRRSKLGAAGAAAGAAERGLSAGSLREPPRRIFCDGQCDA